MDSSTVFRKSGTKGPDSSSPDTVPFLHVFPDGLDIPPLFKRPGRGGEFLGVGVSGKPLDYHPEEAGQELAAAAAYSSRVRHL